MQPNSMEDGPIRLRSGVSTPMTKYFSRTLIVVLLVFLKMPLRADSIPEIVAKAKPAIVEIVVTDATAAPKTLGTGLVVTNFHVVQGASSIAAINNNSTVFLFQKIVAQSPDVDLAILKFQANDGLGRSIDMVEGKRVIVIGNPTVPRQQNTLPAHSSRLTPLKRMIRQKP
jgi:S1-C subfamily serine protease